VVIALIVTPDGLPLAYEVMAGNTSDKTTLRDFIKRIETQYGRARRTWVMDRGIPTEKVLAEMRAAETPIQYLVGTPRGRLGQLEKNFLTKPWAQVRSHIATPARMVSMSLLVGLRVSSRSPPIDRTTRPIPRFAGRLRWTAVRPCCAPACPAW
jgi:hypothetical protein